MKIEELNIEIDDVNDYIDEATNIFDDFCIDLEKDKSNIQELDEDSLWMQEEGLQWLWTLTASRQIEAKLKELILIGNKYFPNDDIEIISTYWKEL